LWSVGVSEYKIHCFDNLLTIVRSIDIPQWITTGSERSIMRPVREDEVRSHPSSAFSKARPAPTGRPKCAPS
jgi:hypothetical protein